MYACLQRETIGITVMSLKLFILCKLYYLLKSIVLRFSRDYFISVNLLTFSFCKLNLKNQSKMLQGLSKAMFSLKREKCALGKCFYITWTARKEKW